MHSDHPLPDLARVGLAAAVKSAYYSGYEDTSSGYPQTCGFLYAERADMVLPNNIMTSTAGEERKACSKCNTALPIQEFSLLRSGKPKSQCKSCVAAYSVQARAKRKASQATEPGSSSEPQVPLSPGTSPS